MKIMIVDDHAEMRRMLRTVISASTLKFVEIIECESGEEAVGQYAIHLPDWVLMDVELKSMNGFEATEEIRRKNSEANIIIVTSYDTPSFKTKAEKLQTKGFILKDKLSDLLPILQNISI